MAEDTETLDEVVVVGYGVQKKVNLTGSVASVKGDALEHRPVVDATQSLQGLVPGLSVSNGGSGRPGATGSLSLRGQGNLSGNSAPYVLVDGVEMSLSDVNPNDIENISVLKDAAACAIYGARAAYGVILVTTKQGEEGKMRASYQGTLGWSAPTVLPDMVNSLDFVKFWNDGVSNTGAANRMYSEQKIADLEQYMRDPSSIDPWGDLAPGESLNAAFENSERGLGIRIILICTIKIIALSITIISVLAGVARKHNIMFPEAIIMRTVFCAMLIWTIHAIRLMPISLQN